MAKNDIAATLSKGAKNFALDETALTMIHDALIIQMKEHHAMANTLINTTTIGLLREQAQQYENLANLFTKETK